MAEIKKESFGKLSDGREVFLFTLRNTKGTEVKVTSYGARLVSYIVRDKDFKKRDIVLGYDNAEAYEKDTTSMGGVVGRHANRIAGELFPGAITCEEVIALCRKLQKAVAL